MSITDTVEWKLCHFEQLSASRGVPACQTSHRCLRCRANCAYAELDGLDLLPGTAHLFA